MRAAFLAALMLFLLPLSVQAEERRVNGDRSFLAQMSRDVTNSIRAQRKAKSRRRMHCSWDVT